MIERVHFDWKLHLVRLSLQLTILHSLATLTARETVLGSLLGGRAIVQALDGVDLASSFLL